MIWLLLACAATDDDTSPADALCAVESRGAPLATGATFDGEVVTVTIGALDPEPLELGTNAVTLELSQVCAVSDSSLYMPDHGHGGPVGELVADGTELHTDGMQFAMGGYWELTLELDCEGTADTVLVPFCVEP